MTILDTIGDMARSQGFDRRQQLLSLLKFTNNGTDNIHELATLCCKVGRPKEWPGCRVDFKQAVIEECGRLVGDRGDRPLMTVE